MITWLYVWNEALFKLSRDKLIAPRLDPSMSTIYALEFNVVHKIFCHCLTQVVKSHYFWYVFCMFHETIIRWCVTEQPVNWISHSILLTMLKNRSSKPWANPNAMPSNLPSESESSVYWMYNPILGLEILKLISAMTGSESPTLTVQQDDHWSRAKWSSMYFNLVLHEDY